MCVDAHFWRKAQWQKKPNNKGKWKEKENMNGKSKLVNPIGQYGRNDS